MFLIIKQGTINNYPEQQALTRTHLSKPGCVIALCHCIHIYFKNIPTLLKIKITHKKVYKSIEEYFSNPDLSVSCYFHSPQ